MKITRERLEEILREEITAVAEGGAQGHMDSDYMNALADSPYGQIMKFMSAQSNSEYEKAAQIVKDLKQSVPSDQWPKIEAVLDKSANLKRMSRNDPYRKELRNELKADLETVKAMLLPESKLKLGKDDLQENMFSNLKTSIDKVLRPGKYEDRKGTEFTVKRFNEAHELLAKAQQIINEFEPPLANKIDVVASKVLKMRNQMLNEGVIQQEAPPVQNNQRARELLDGFKNMLKPEETAEPSACGTFLRQLADMADHESGTSDAGTMPEPLPNN